MDDSISAFLSGSGFQSPNKYGYQFPDPFLDMASSVTPRSFRELLNLCDLIWLKNGTYRMACQRIVRYFITKPEFDGLDAAQREKLTTYLIDTFSLSSKLSLIGDDFLAYGNSVSSVIVPFQRFLVCTETGFEQPIHTAKWKFRNFQFTAYNSRVKKWTKHRHVDRRLLDEAKISIRRWNLRDIKIKYHPYYGNAAYYWKIPKKLIDSVREGDPFIISSMPWEIIDAIRNEQLFLFNDDAIYHLKEEGIAGIESGGWGLPRMLSVFPQAWYSQVLKRSNESLAMDYVVPFRVMTPMAGNSPHGDPLLGMDASRFVSSVTGMLKEHRQDPATWHTLPFPLQYQALGGEANAMSTPDLLNQATDEMLNAIGIPAELYRGSLQTQALPTALRLFQQTWPQLVTGFNGWLSWAVNKICTAMNWDAPSHAGMQPVTLADDVELRQIWLQLASSNLISRSTAFSPWGVDAVSEQKKIFDEQRQFADMQKNFQDDMMNRDALSQQMAAGMMGGQLTPPGMPGGVPPPQGMGGGVPAAQSNAGLTPEDLMGQADQMAQQLVSTPYEARRKVLHDLQQSNTTLHALVKQRMADLRSDASSVGRDMVLQGQQQPT